MTYSIAAHDAATGELGVAVQSAWFAVGRAVPWVEPGVGAIATQAFTRTSFGPDGLRLLRGGISASDTLRALTTRDSDQRFRQVAVVDAAGGTATHTGTRCPQAAGHLVGNGYSVQANMAQRPAVWEAMAEGFESSRGPLAGRLLIALEAGETAGGDFRGRQSAAILVAPGHASAEPWERVTDLRVDDHPNPLDALRQLLKADTAYRYLTLGQAAAAQPRSALRANHRTWADALHAAQAGKVDLATDLLQSLVSENTRWRDSVRAYGERGHLPYWQEILTRLASDND